AQGSMRSPGSPGAGAAGLRGWKCRSTVARIGALPRCKTPCCRFARRDSGFPGSGTGSRRCCKAEPRMRPAICSPPCSSWWTSAVSPDHSAPSTTSTPSRAGRSPPTGVYAMSTLRTILALTAVLALTQTVQAQQGYPVRFDLGTTPTPQDLAELFAIPPDGRGLPPGKGTYAQGEKVYPDYWAVCQGDKLQGNPTAGIGGDKRIGGRGTLASAAPVKTVESYWPYATTLFDYVKR